MAHMSDYERASVQHRIEMVREYIYTLGHEMLSASERADNLRSALEELRHFEEVLTNSDEEQTSGSSP